MPSTAASSLRGHGSPGSFSEISDRTYIQIEDKSSEFDDMERSQEQSSANALTVYNMSWTEKDVLHVRGLPVTQDYAELLYICKPSLITIWETLSYSLDY